MSLSKANQEDEYLVVQASGGRETQGRKLSDETCSRPRQAAEFIPEINLGLVMATLSTLPLQVRVGLRDSFDATDSAVNIALKSLNETTGYTMTLEIAWVDIWRDLHTKFDDKTTFVPAVTQAITLFIQRLESLLESSEPFQEIFLTKMERLRKALFVQIHDAPLPKLEFVRGELMTLFIPAQGAEGLRSISSRIGSDIEEVFTGKARKSVSPEPVEPNDDFVEVLPRTLTTRPTARVVSLPKVDTLARPETLFASVLPYTIIVRRTGQGIDIEGTHQPTLELICEYFKKHGRKNLNDTRQISYFKTELIQSAWSSGTYHDAVRISKEDTRASWVHAEITPILAFVEGVCGYDLLRSDGEWVFRRVEPFQ